MDFGNILKELRSSKKLTQLQLSQILDTSKSNISKYEAGSVEPNMETLMKISEYFGVSIDYLLGKSDDRETEQSEPEYTTRDERQLLDLYRDYVDNGFSNSTVEGLQTFFHECTFNFDELTHSEKKILKTFHYLNEDNQDIIIGKAKDLLREQEAAVAADSQSLRKASGK